jgi:hypothetical protein
VPKVSFVVPCYRLAHLLPECLESILTQTFRDFEVLVMDDCSPDDTPGVVRRIGDPRVRHVRNPVNLRHLRNYNRGIELSSGEYVWLISADDRLRTLHAIERYVALLEARPDVGYVFCPGVGLRDGVETGVLDYSRHGDGDAVFEGPAFVRTLLRGNSVVAASGLVRRSLYERLGAFPLDLPYAGDWYLWLRFAVHANVGYIAEPMVHYREHAQSATSGFMADPTHPWKGEGITVVWRIRREVEAAGRPELIPDCLDSLVHQYGSSMSRYGMSPGAFEVSLASAGADRAEIRSIRVRSYLHAGDDAFWRGERRLATALYGRAFRAEPARTEAAAKFALARLGRFGDRLRGGFGGLRRRLPEQGPASPTT